MAKRKKTFVYVPQVDKIYNSIAEAARALQVDAGNISKVLKGKRKTVGNLDFISAVGKGGGKKRKSTLRREYEERIRTGGKKPPKPPIDVFDPLRNKKSTLENSIKAVNEQLRRLKAAGLLSFSSAAKALLGLGDDLGRTSAGYLATSGKRWDRLTEAQIDKFLEVIERKQKLRSYTIEGATAEAERLANNFGTTAQRIIDLSGGLPLFFNILKNLSRDQSSDNVLDEIDAFEDPDATPEDFLQQLLDITNDQAVLQGIADTLGGDDLFMLDKYLPIREDLENLTAAAAADPEGLADTIAEVREYISNSLYYDDVDDVNDMIHDTIETALRGR